MQEYITQMLVENSGMNPQHAEVNEQLDKLSIII